VAPPRIVALGGGSGLSVTLRALRTVTDDLTAVVSVADDGGSSGRLRQALGIPAPGDIRRCLVALADDDSVLARSFEHRFAAGELEGHPLGNLVIAGLAAATGDFRQALEEAGRLLGAVGRVLPATAEPVILVAESEAGSVAGEVAVAEAGRIAAVGLVPATAAAPPEVPEAILAADLVVLGPGSLFTSVLAACAVPDVRLALERTAATRVLVCNLDVAERETAGFDVAAHVLAVRAHGVPVDVVLADADALPYGDPPVPVVARPLAAVGHRRHDEEQLAKALSDLLGWRA
jgi:uncharacterized cofD-like protein